MQGLDGACPADAAARSGVEISFQAFQIDRNIFRQLNDDRVLNIFIFTRQPAVANTRYLIGSLDNSLGEEKTRREFRVVAGRAHRDRDRFVFAARKTETYFEGFFHGERVGLYGFLFIGGYPYARRLLVTGLAQGPFMVDATARGDAQGTNQGYRTDPTYDWNLKISRTFLGRLHVSAEVFNLLNLGSKMRVADLTGPQFVQNLPLEIQPPRFARGGISWEF